MNDYKIVFTWKTENYILDILYMIHQYVVHAFSLWGIARKKHSRLFVKSLEKYLSLSSL